MHGCVFSCAQNTAIVKIWAQLLRTRVAFIVRHFSTIDPSVVLSFVDFLFFCRNIKIVLVFLGLDRFFMSYLDSLYPMRVERTYHEIGDEVLSKHKGGD